MRIGEFAARAGVSAHTLRYYERVGLLPPAERSAHGYRLYAPGAARRVRLLRALRGLGFGVRELGAVADVLEGRLPRVALRAKLRAKRDAVGARLATLERSYRLLDALQRCDCRGECTLVGRLVDGDPPPRGTSPAPRRRGARVARSNGG